MEIDSITSASNGEDSLTALKADIDALNSSPNEPFGENVTIDTSNEDSETASKSQIVANMDIGDTDARSEFGGIYTGDVRNDFVFSRTIADTSVKNQEFTLNSLVVNNSTVPDAVAIVGYGRANVSDAIVFGGNLIVGNTTGLTNTKLVGLEIDVEPTLGTTVNSGGGGLFINAFNVAMGVPAIQTGGINGGTFNNGIVLYGISDSGAGLSGGSSETMDSLVNSGGATYSTGAIILSNTHKQVFKGTSTSHAIIYNDDSNNLRIVNGSGSIVFRNNADSASLISINDSGIMAFENTNSTIDIKTGGAEAVSTGVGSVKMGNASAANNAAWIPIKYNGTTYYVPGWADYTP